MKIEKITTRSKDNVITGDIIESKYSGVFYLIVKNNNGKYCYVNLKDNVIPFKEFNTPKEAVEYITDHEIVIHKSENVKLTIQD